MSAPHDAPGFADWVRPSLLSMTRLARRLAPDADPDDVVQDSLVRAWQKWHQYDAARGTPTTWLLAITADRARNARRERIRRLRVVDDHGEPPDAPPPDPAHDLASGVAGDLDLERAVAALTDRQQLAVHLHYFLGLTVDETAAVMGCAPGTVKSTLHDARARLREFLGGDDDEH